MLFVDTVYLLALLVKADALHDRAVIWRHAVKKRSLLTTQYVLLEVLDGIASQEARQAGLEIYDFVHRSPQFTTVAGSPAVYQDGLDLYRRRRDKNWQLTDCISFQVMRQYGIRDALTYDHHFEQAGFRALLRHEVSDLI